MGWQPLELKDEFDGTRDDCLQYVERLEHFFLANSVDDTAIRSANCHWCRDLLIAGEKPYAELVESLSKHFKPTPSEIVERFRFHSRVWKASESISTNYDRSQSTATSVRRFMI